MPWQECLHPFIVKRAGINCSEKGQSVDEQSPRSVSEEDSKPKFIIMGTPVKLQGPDSSVLLPDSEDLKKFCDLGAFDPKPGFNPDRTWGKCLTRRGEYGSGEYGFWKH